MALSYYTTWGHQQLNQELPPPEFLNFYDNYLLSDTCIDPLFDQNNYFYYDETPLTTLPPPPQPPQTFDSYTYPKRIKSQNNFYFHDTSNTYNYIDHYHNFFVPNPPLLPEFSPELVVPLSEFQPSNTRIMPRVYSCGSITSRNVEKNSSTTRNNNVENIITSGNVDNIISATTTSISISNNNVKKENGEGVSAQSIAARLRRRKITEKTQELGKLIPGGQKMNTAEMFQAASKYIKFLQAQVGMLELMGSNEDSLENESLYSPQLHALVTSPSVQEKLYSKEKCLVPRKFVETLAGNHEIQSNPQLITDIVRLL